MANKSVATIQSLSGYGKSSLTVALPILSSAGLETAVLPSVVLSSHTGYAENFKMLLNDFIGKSLIMWEKNSFCFDALYTGYLCSKEQINDIIKSKDAIIKNGGLFFCDPVMGDNGKLYSGFDKSFPEQMLRLCKAADIITPNLTEACLLTNTEYKLDYDKPYIETVINKLIEITDSKVVLTGISLDNKNILSAICQKDRIDYIGRKKQPQSYHGTGDAFTSCLVSAILCGRDIISAAEFAMEFVSRSIVRSLSETDDEKKGLAFEKQLYLLNQLLVD